MKYQSPRRMKPVSLKLPEDLEALLDRLASERNLTRSDVVREALRAYAAEVNGSVIAAAGDLVGALDGPADLSVARKHMAGFGE
jgi:Arc/MetJ-type ribon-helix-helix transcriptional regulator